MAEATGFFRADEVEIAAELVRERLEKGIASGYEFVFADGVAGEVMGYACYGEIPCTIGSYDLYWIIVDPKHQGKGLGRALVAEAERRIAVKGGRRIYIETSSMPQYEPTQGFYTACGYTIEARFADFYKPGDAKLVYAKAVGP